MPTTAEILVHMERLTTTPKVSVCVITYNQEQYIGQCLQSIVDQKTDFVFEVIVGDDCSTDGTKAIIEQFKIRYPGVIFPIYQTRNIGGGINNYLTIHNAARGEYVAHVDGDDYLLPNKLQRQKQFLDENKNFTASWHKVRVENLCTKRTTTSGGLREIYKDGIVTLDKLLRYGMAGVHSSIMYRRSARVTTTPEFDFLDLFYSLEFMESGNGMLLNEVLGAYRVLNRAISNKNKLATRKLCAHHVAHFFKNNPHLRRDVYIYALTNFIIDAFHGRPSSLDFLKLAIRSFIKLGPRTIFLHIQTLKYFR